MSDELQQAIDYFTELVEGDYPRGRFTATFDDAWSVIRAGLARLAEENRELHVGEEDWHTRLATALGEVVRETLRAEAAEAELAALKQKIADDAMRHNDRVAAEYDARMLLLIR